MFKTDLRETGQEGMDASSSG